MTSTSSECESPSQSPSSRVPSIGGSGSINRRIEETYRRNLLVISQLVQRKQKDQLRPARNAVQDRSARYGTSPNLLSNIAVVMVAFVERKVLHAIMTRFDRLPPRTAPRSGCALVANTCAAPQSRAAPRMRMTFSFSFSMFLLAGMHGEYIYIASSRVSTVVVIVISCPSNQQSISFELVSLHFHIDST
jgi:hypothetical protein